MKNCLHCKGEIKRGKYCSNQCQKDYEYESYILRWKAGLESGMQGLYSISRHIKRYLFEKYSNKCAECSWSKINTYSGKIPLEVEHIDGNYENNKEDNLTLLCPNCHSLTPTYKFLNAGNGRKHRRNVSLPRTNTILYDEK